MSISTSGCNFGDPTLPAINLIPIGYFFPPGPWSSTPIFASGYYSGDPTASGWMEPLPDEPKKAKPRKNPFYKSDPYTGMPKDG